MLATFLGRPACEPRAQALRAVNARCGFLGAPIETHFYPIRSGTALGPGACRAASQPYASATPLEGTVNVAESWNIVDCGDVVAPGGETREFHERLRRAATEIMSAGALPVIFGGDHSIPIAGVPALAEMVRGPIGYVHIDAHLDIADEIGGVRDSMGSSLARVLEHPQVDATNVAVLAARGAGESSEAVAAVLDHGVRLFPMADIVKRGIDAVMRDVVDVIWHGTEAVYVSMDNDALDASVAPGTTVPEPFGLTSRELMTVALAIGRAGVSMMDIVELSPLYDPAGITARIDVAFVLYVLGTYADALARGAAHPVPYA
jgi:agmatinase